MDSLGELQCTEELQGLDILQLFNIHINIAHLHHAI